MATERGNLPPLHPIFEQLSQALAKQKAAERLENPSPRKHVVSPKREYMQDWRKKNPEKHRQNVDRWQHSEKGKAYKAAWQQENRRRKKKAQMSEQPDTFPDPSATTTPERPRLIDHGVQGEGITLDDGLIVPLSLFLRCRTIMLFRKICNRKWLIIVVKRVF